MGIDAGTSLTELLSGTDGGTDVQLCNEPVRLTGGRSSDVFKVRLRAGPDDLVDRPVVLRIGTASRGDQLGGLIQQGVAMLGYSTPRVLRLGVDGANRSCLLMEWSDGPTLFDSLGPIRASRAAPTRLANLMGLLHGLDPAAVRAHLDVPGVGVPHVVSQALRDIDEFGLSTNLSRLHQVRDWLVAHRPTLTPDVVCHGDLHALNVIVTAGSDVVIDWDSAGLGPREFDVARTKLLFEAVPFTLPRLARPIVERAGRRGAARFERAYQSPLDTTALEWFEVLHSARIIGLVEAATPGEVNAVVEGWTPTLPFLRRRVRDLCGTQPQSR